MPLVNSPTLTPKTVAANRANAQLSRAPITLKGRQVGRLTDLLLKLKRGGVARPEQKKNLKYEGESHDVVDNKGSDFLSHDVDGGQWIMRCQVTKNASRWRHGECSKYSHSREGGNPFSKFLETWSSSKMDSRLRGNDCGLKRGFKRK